MHLIQILLPLYSNDKKAFPKDMYNNELNILKERFGGVTIYRQAPAEGLWDDSAGETNFDELITVEVMAGELEEKWWKTYKKTIENSFQQQAIIIRASVFDLL